MRDRGPGRSSAEAGDVTPLIVDFDGTLSLADTLAWLRYRCSALSAEAELERQSRLQLSKQAEKIYLWQIVGLAVDDLPFDLEVIEWLRQRSDAGRRLILVTGSAQGLADAVAGRLGLFDAAWGSNPKVNLTGPRKAAALVEAFGPGGYDYVGDSAADLPVWQSARAGFCVIRPSTPPFDLPDNVEMITSDRSMIDPTGRAYDHVVGSVDV